MPYYRMLANSLAAFALAGGLALSAGSAQAFSLVFGPNSTSSNSPATGASAQVDFALTDVGSDTVEIMLTLMNTTGQIPSFGAGATTSKFTGFTFDLPMPVAFVAGSFMANLGGGDGTEFDTIIEDVDFNPFSNSVGNFDIGVADNGNFEGGNANAALAQGQTDILKFRVSPSSVNGSSLYNALFNGFSDGSLNFAARFQQVNAGEGSDKLLGGDVIPVPLPAAGWLLAVGLGGVGFLLRKRC